MPTKQRSESARKIINARARDKYHLLRDDGMCTKCAKRYAEAGRSLCRRCANNQKISSEKCDPGGNRHKAWINNRNKERKEAGVCVDCGKKLTDMRFVRCKPCRNRRAIYQQVKRIRKRLHNNGNSAVP